MVPGFTDIQDHNVVWGTYQDEFTYNWLYNYSSFVCSWCYGYVTQNVWKLINSKDYYNIPEGDVRRLWWLSPDGPNVADYWKATTASGTTARQYIEEMNMPQYSVLKFAPYQNVIQTSVNASSMPTIRIEEMYMILAEAQALGGNLSQGVATLTNFVNTYRWSGSGSYQPTIASTDDFIDEIYFQRSIEFWGEGITYFDNMRFQRGINRKNSMWDSAYGQEIGVLGIAFDILPDNPVLIFQIPRGEIDNNKALTDADQNEPGQAAL